MIHRCRACDVAELSVHPGFARALAERESPPQVVYLWADRTVTDLPLLPSAPVYTSDDSSWQELCDRLIEPAG